MNQPSAGDAGVNSRPWWDNYFEQQWDAHGGGEQTRYFMETALAHLPEPEKAYLSGNPLTVLDWGCAFGEGVAALSRAFPRSRVAGLDFSKKAIDEAGVRHAGHEFIWSEDGAIPRDFDCIVTSNCLEHFEQPLAMLERHLASCKGLYIVLVPYNECPLHPQHRAQFRVESFPHRVRDFARIHAGPIDSDPHFWPGQQLLVVYASEGYLNDAVNRVESMSLIIAKLEAVRIAERQRADEAEAGLKAERRRAEALEAERNAERRRAEALEAERNAERRRAEALEAERNAERLRGEEAERNAERLRGEEAEKQWIAQRNWTAASEAERASERRAAEALRLRAAKGLRDFQSQFDKQLSGYRSQRAWRVMLAFRKAYTMLARRKWRGVVFSGLDEFDLSFPQALNFVPEELTRPGEERSRPPRAATPDRQYDIVVLPIFDFDFRFQRPQQIAVQFARAGHRVFWISPARQLPASSAQRYESIQIRENVWEIHLRAAPFDLYRGALDPSQEAALVDGLDHLYRDKGIAASCAILQFPFWRRIGLALRERFGAKLVYDCMDDWQNWPTEPLPGEFSLAEERKLVGESDVLVVTSRELHERHATSGIESKLIPNAADFEFFHNPPAGSPLANLARPIVGYFGAIADWFDLELIIEVVRSRPRYSFALIGQVHLLDVSALKALPNAHLLGEKPYRELPAYLREFDVCTLPFRMNRLTRAVDPVKVYEYLSQGKPAVSTPLPELAPLSGLLYFAEGPEEFAKQIDRALEERDETLAAKRVAFASANTWASRVQVLDQAIRANYPLVSILVVTYNTREYLGPFFDSNRRATSYPSYEIIVVDNHSNDGSAEDLKTYALTDRRIRAECLDRNLGFAGGNNFAARLAQGEYLVLLNPDTVLTDGWLERLLRPIEKDPGVGLVAPVSNFSGNETKVNTYYRSLEEMEDFASECAIARRGESIGVDVAPLFCGLLRRKVWDEVGELDEGFEIGTFEDDDFSLRVRKAGYRIVTAEDCFIHHFGNGSFGKLEQDESHRIFKKNKQRFEDKWNTVWLPHRTRPGVRPISPDNRVELSDFFGGDGAGGL
jgi:GT2 family glycosyltransferase/SAM-dependent methyltransferase